MYLVSINVDWLKTVKITLTYSVLMSMSHIATAMTQDEHTIGLTALAAKGDQDAIFQLGTLYLDPNSNMYFESAGIKLLTSLAREGHAAAMHVLANYYVLPDSTHYKLSRATFWFKHLRQLGELPDEFLYALTLLDSHKATDELISQVLDNPGQELSWQYLALEGRAYQLGIGRKLSVVDAKNRYLQSIALGGGVKRYLKEVNVDMYSPSVEGHRLMNMHVDLFVSTFDTIHTMTQHLMPDPLYRAYRVQYPEIGSLSSFAVKLNEDSCIDQVTQYFTTSNDESFSHLKANLISRFGSDHNTQSNATIWTMTGLEIVLIENKSNEHRLITTMKEV
jgi:hypothetical protein